MKSIKEKAIEVFPGHCNTYTNESNMKKRIGFEVGANYVLEKIEEIIKYDKDPRVIEALKERIWRLKNDGNN